MHYPEAFPHYLGADLKAIRADGIRGTKNWFPDRYEATTREHIPVHESLVKRDRSKRADEAAFRAAHTAEFVSTGFGSDNTGSWVPDGYTVLSARLDDTRETREFLVPRAEAIADDRLRPNVVIDPRRHLDITGIGELGNPAPAPQRPLITGEQLRIDLSGLTGAQQRRASAELNRRCRFPDGASYVTETLAEHLARVGVTGKEPIAFGNKPGVGYYVRLQASHVLQVSKASFDALTGVPNVCDEEGRASIAVRNAEQRLERAEREWDLEKIHKARADTEHAHAAHKAASHAKHAHEIPWAQRQAMRRGRATRPARRARHRTQQPRQLPSRYPRQPPDSHP
jgi:hypothetical protein